MTGAPSQPLRPSLSPVSLREVLTSLPTHADFAGPDLSISGISLNSATILPGDVFAALPGVNAHGARYAPEAISRGAVAIFTDIAGAHLLAGEAPTGVAVVTAKDPRALVGSLAAEIFGRPADRLLTLGVTGTNGKTTTTYLLRAGLEAAGHHTGLIGTVATLIGDEDIGASTRTTPEAPELHALLAVMRERGVTAVAMEVSSHALAQGRVDGWCFDVAGFTQLGRDHLDFHGSEASYFQAKSRLFTPEHSGRAVITVDDEGGERMATASAVPTKTLSTRHYTDWWVDAIEAIPDGGWSFDLHGVSRHIPQCQVPLIGRFNVGNAALALAMLGEASLNLEAAKRGIAAMRPVPGRMERIPDDHRVLLVDYAHTAEALDRALRAVQPIARTSGGRVIVVFGCGGDRDPSKRGPMGEVAARLADLVVVTDDNPRSEDPAAIRAEVLAGARRITSDDHVREIGDRREAIATAVSAARSGDVVLVAGKGHETGQETAGRVVHFDDREEVSRARLARVTGEAGHQGREEPQ